MGKEEFEKLIQEEMKSCGIDPNKKAESAKGRFVKLELGAEENPMPNETEEEFERRKMLYKPN